MAKPFEGRYYKHQRGGETVCVLLGRAGEREYLQVAVNDRLWRYDSLEGCQASGHGLRLARPEIWGEVRYGPLRPLPPEHIGPLRRREVVSMGHCLTGSFVVEGRRVELTGGRGYIEGGRPLPRRYLWLHCSAFPHPLSIMAAVADRSLCGVHLPACVCAVAYQGRAVRLSSCRGARIAAADQSSLVLEQGPLCLLAELTPLSGGPAWPYGGRAAARFCLYEHGRLLFDEESDHCSFAYFL